jgi:hypothetical protein
MTLAIRPAQATLLAALRRAGRPRFVVIGATALHHHVPLRRQTADVDLAVVADPEEIAAVLRSQRGWTADPTHADRWKNGDESVDVVPASSTLVEAGVVRFERGGKELSLVGFDLALAHTVLVPVLDVEVEVAELPALVVLKMIAWRVLRRPQRARDRSGGSRRPRERVPDEDRDGLVARDSRNRGRLCRRGCRGDGKAATRCLRSGVCGTAPDETGRIMTAKRTKKAGAKPNKTAARKQLDPERRLQASLTEHDHGVTDAPGAEQAPTPLLDLAGTGRGLWGPDSAEYLRHLRDEWH